MGISGYFKGAVLARMSDGTYCIIRPLGLVKGGKGLKHHENLLKLSVRGVAAKLPEIARLLVWGVQPGSFAQAPQARLARSGAPAPRRSAG
jgi:hypothetical protein